MLNIELFSQVTELLNYFTGTFVIDKDFAAGGVAKISAVGIGENWTIGEYAQLTGTDNSNIVIRITDIAGDDSYILAVAAGEGGTIAAFGADEAGSGDEKMNQIVYSDWRDLSGFWEISGTVYASGACDVWLQQSWAGTYIDFDGTKVDVAAATSTLVDEDVKCLFGRMKILSQDAVMTVMRANFGGKM